MTNISHPYYLVGKGKLLVVGKTNLINSRLES
jgi:hypothetical protein